MIFCGSVIRYRYPFKRLQNQFTKPILNEVGTRDIWPAIAESVTVGYGSAGTYGFRKPLIRDRWHNRAKHGYFLNRKFCRKFWIPFLRDGTVVESSEKPERPSPILVLLSIFKVKYLAMLLAALMAVWIWQQKWPFWPQKPYPIAAYLGTWQNLEQTLGITRVTVREEGPDVLVKIWGSCRPTDCEIPELKGHVYGASVQARAVDKVRAVEAELVESYANRRFILRLLNENTLSVEARTRFIDNSGRSDFQFTDTLEKTSN